MINEIKLNIKYSLLYLLHATLLCLRLGRHFHSLGKPQVTQDAVRNAIYQSPTDAS